MVQFFIGDCKKVFHLIKSDSIDCVVTSPPYNIGLDYGVYYSDQKPYPEYLGWLYSVCIDINRVLKEDGSFFLNLGNKPSEQLFVNSIIQDLSILFKVQNTIIWVKSFDGNGHFKPINSNRFLNGCFEYVFHLTKNKDVELDKLSIGIPYTDKTNIKRWNRERDLRDRGNVWFIPYETKQIKDKHPAIFPQELPERCIKLHGVKAGMQVLDPFMGIGTTGLACKKLGVNFIGIDINPKYVEIAKNNIQSFIWK